MAPHSSTLAWKIPWVEEPSRLQSMGSLRVGHNWATSLSLFTFMHWRRKWQPTPVFLPGESQGRGERGGLPSMGSHRVGHDWSDLAAAAAVIRTYSQVEKPSSRTHLRWTGPHTCDTLRWMTGEWGIAPGWKKKCPWPFFISGMNEKVGQRNLETEATQNVLSK